ncbi:glycerol-3-phosphate responsive antiterminator [Salibacterium salarium]|uniref:Glycerol-3-phosphate responsive antiterminator n=1 Tax=Salibacterium salarium TaxID=284579 RepID=A0A428MWT9_9BACI|nr:glycerol-3-phosphate responsive antiterminator [Salibacterium salarium]RSL30635.1 glycerol-3-phosphate responsive antiterminator [Salibacterium salarium]
MRTVPEYGSLKDRLYQHKKIAAIKKPKDMEKVIEYRDRISAVFLVTGNIITVKKYVEELRKYGLPSFVHIEKIGGLSLDKDGLDLVARYVRPLGIVTTKPKLLNKAKKRGLLTIQRVFLIDSEVYDHVCEIVESNYPDYIEIMPSRLPSLIKEISKQVSIPIITGGLLSEKEHALQALENGAQAVSTSNPSVWKEVLNSSQIDKKENNILRQD